MFIAGLKLLLVGMLMVLFFLLLMVFLIKVIEILNRSHANIEEQQIKKQRQVPLKLDTTGATFPAAVLAAAVYAFEEDRRQNFIP